MSKSAKRSCFSRVLGAGGVAFLALVSNAENLENYLFATGTVWIVAGTIIAGAWAFETLCDLEGGNDDD